MLVYKPKQNSKQHTGLKYAIYIEMADQKFSLTSQCHKTTILHITFNLLLDDAILAFDF